MLAAASLLIPASAVAAPPERMEVSARPITQFHIGHDETRFGPLTFVGGLEMTSDARDFGSMSAFRFRKPGSDFIGVADTGYWYFGRIEHDAAGRPSGVSRFTMQAMVDVDGNIIGRKWLTDAEGLGIRGDIATAGFERSHRISEFRIDPADMKAPIRDLDFLVPRKELRMNKGFETIAYAPEDGPLEGARVIVSEKSLDENGNQFAAILEGPEKGVFSVKRSGKFDITDGAFLPNGDLLLLERSFSYADGVAMQLRRIDGKTIAKGKLADGPVLFQADMSYQIDNMEGLDVWRRDDGALIVSIVSDDNQSLLQRNLYLEFKLDE
ncbi:esterase-like activity of phytase family protein [Mesorhizobium koreense]|uniref:esterase-like activity of phytase family protein n=1 Tax=Mesorhizobium koreense TaxID=3074855 RepID=UPI00287BA5EF|nr:esterase-like activity of phytase family protein [Mesorhizobium sp. WR6]